MNKHWPHLLLEIIDQLSIQLNCNNYNISSHYHFAIIILIIQVIQIALFIVILTDQPQQEIYLITIKVNIELINYCIIV